jgi:zinc and cadmium transporter
MQQLLFYSLIGGLFSLLGGLALVWRADLVKKFTTTLLAFSAGAFLAASFLDILPEALEMVEEPHPVLLAALIGFLIFFAIERYFMRFTRVHEGEECNDHGEHTESLPYLLIVGDSFHNFLDGIVIALSWLADPSLGLVTTLAVAAHEIPQEIGDFSILLNQGWAKSRVIMINIAQSLLTVLGALVGYYAGSAFEPYLPYLLAGAAGIFIYISASDLIPEVHHHASHKQFLRVIFPLLIGIAAVWFLSGLAHAS